jgi:hypothetical protein
MGLEHVSELQPPTGLLFIPQVIYVLPSESSSSEARGTGQGNDEFCLTKHLFHTSKGFLTCKILRHGADGVTSPPKDGLLRILSPLKIHLASAGFAPATLRSNNKHANR